MVTVLTIYGLLGQKQGVLSGGQVQGEDQRILTLNPLFPMLWNKIVYGLIRGWSKNNGKVLQGEV